MTMTVTIDRTKPVLDYNGGNSRASGGLFGNWSISFPDNTGLTFNQRDCIAEAVKRGWKKKDIQWTKAARDAGFAALRARYGRR